MYRIISYRMQLFFSISSFFVCYCHTPPFNSLLIIKFLNGLSLYKY